MEWKFLSYSFPFSPAYRVQWTEAWNECEPLSLYYKSMLKVRKDSSLIYTRNVAVNDTNKIADVIDVANDSEA